MGVMIVGYDAGTQTGFVDCRSESYQGVGLLHVLQPLHNFRMQGINDRIMYITV